MNAAPPQLDIPLLTLRAMFVLSSVGLGAYLARLGENSASVEFLAMVVALALALVVIGVDALAIARSSITTVSAIAFGLLIGFIAAQLFIGVVSLMGDFSGATGQAQLNGIRLALTVIFCYLGPAYLLRTKDDFRFIVPYVEFQRQDDGPRPLVLDTSAIIDGRVVDLAAGGLFDAPFVVPRDVVEELQRIADSGDRNRRDRGRRGLDRLKTLRELAGVEVELPHAADGEPGAEVDRRLVETARARRGKLVTVDLNLQKVCELEGVAVLNLNQIARAVRPQFLPGDTLALRIVRKGEGATQGVGYLDDGTMVVVEGAHRHKGKQVSAVVTSSIQNAAGQMVFARRVEAEGAQAGPAADDDATPQPTPASAGEREPA